jgi:hypothetical protein
MDGVCSMHWADKNCSANSSRERLLVRPRRKLKDNIKTDLTCGHEDVDWMFLAQDAIEKRSLVIVIMTLLVRRDFLDQVSYYPLLKNDSTAWSSLFQNPLIMLRGNTSVLSLILILYRAYMEGTRGSVVGWGTMLQVGMSLVRFPMGGRWIFQLT